MVVRRWLSSSALSALLACSPNAHAPDALPLPPALSPAPASPVWTQRASAYLDRRAMAWMLDPPKAGNNVPCALSCHTTHPFLFARPLLGGSRDAMSAVRAKIEARVTSVTAWRDATAMYGKPRSDKAQESLATEAVLNAAALAWGGADTPGATRALDHMVSMQRGDGAWDWLDFGLEPWETGDSDLAASIAALALGSAAPGYASRPETTRAVTRLADYLRRRARDTTKPMSLHDKAMLLFASSRLHTIVDDEVRASMAKELSSAQEPDGSFRLTQLLSSPPKRPNDAGDGYATGLVVLALCESGAPAGPTTTRGLAWLRAHQRDDGSWPGKSVNVDEAQNHMFVSDAATSYAAMALSRCGKSQ